MTLILARVQCASMQQWMKGDSKLGQLCLCQFPTFYCLNTSFPICSISGVQYCSQHKAPLSGLRTVNHLLLFGRIWAYYTLPDDQVTTQ